MSIDPVIYATIAIAYAIAFLIIGSKRPAIALMMVFAGAPFQNDLSVGGGISFSIAEINLLLASLIFIGKWLNGQRALFWGPVSIPVVIYLIMSLISSFGHWRGASTTISLVQMFLYMGVSVIVFCSLPAQKAEYWPALYGLVIVGVFLALASIIVQSNSIFGLQKNGLGGSLAAALLVAMELWFASKSPNAKRGLLISIGILACGLLFSLSRGAWLGTMAGFLAIGLLRQRVALLLRAMIVLGPLMILAWNLLPAESQNYAMDFAPTSYNINARWQSISIAQAYFEQDELLGAGVGLRKQFDATNIIWVALAETGIVGLTLLVSIHVSVFMLVFRGRQRMKEDDAALSLVVIAGALIASKFGHGLVDHYWSRGDLMCAWAAVGMATRIYLEQNYVLSNQWSLQNQVTSNVQISPTVGAAL